jgi:Meiotically up-regulated gene 113
MNDFSSIIRSSIKSVDVSHGDLKAKYPHTRLTIRLPELETGSFKEVAFIPTHRIVTKFEDFRNFVDYVHLIKPGDEQLSNFHQNFWPAPTPLNYERRAHGYDVVSVPHFAFDPEQELWWPYISPTPDWQGTTVIAMEVNYEDSDQRKDEAKSPLILQGYGVYFIQAGETDGPIKIGYSSNVRKRCADIQMYRDEPTSILAFIHCTDKEIANLEEQRYHRKFADQNLKGEWFEPKPILAWLLEHGYWTPCPGS